MNFAPKLLLVLFFIIVSLIHKKNLQLFIFWGRDDMFNTTNNIDMQIVNINL